MSKSAVLEIHPGLVLKGQLSMVKDVVVTGKFEGDLKTLGCLTVADGGEMTGSIEAGALVLEQGHLLAAKVKIEPAVIPQEASPVRSVDPKWESPFQKLRKLAMGRK